MSKDANTINLTALAQEWAEKLQSCEYAGEVVIAETELPAIVQKVRRDLFSDRRSAETRKCLLVLAINCMYYDHDEEGFWVHFCALFDVSNTPQYQSWLGDMLEFELLDLGLLQEPGVGPYKKYINPLRIQCGITRHEIPRFASLLNYLTERYGWDGIRVLDREVFNQNVTACVQGQHLSQFLLDNQGWSFTRDVARSVSQYRRSVLDDEALSQLPGYRTGFFRDLFDALDREPGQDARHLTRPPLPRLVFLPDFRQIAIAFDQQSLNTGCYRMDRENVRRNPIPLDSAEMFDENIQGQRLNSDEVWEPWSFKGWIPTDTPIGLFHVDRGYVDLREGVTPGKYYMVGDYKKPPPKDVELSSYGAVDLPFDDLEYDAWLVEITEATDLKFLGVNEKPLDRITTLIAWTDESNRLPGTYDLEKAFVGKLPRITILRPELFSSNAVGLFVDEGSGARRVRPSNISPGEVHIEVETKSRGRVWVEPISRMREFAGLDTLGELAFCLLPECRINWPNRLYSPTEQPEVELVTKDRAISLEIQDAEPIDDNEWRWKIKSGVSVVQGYLRSGTCEVPLARRVFRADIRKKTEASTRFLLFPEFQHPISLVACGIPGARAELRLTDGQQTKRLGELGVFNEGGEISFSTLAIRDALAGYREPVGVVVGGLSWLKGKWAWLANLPGDITIPVGGGHVVLPLATCAIASIIVAIILAVAGREP